MFQVADDRTDDQSGFVIGVFGMQGLIGRQSRLDRSNFAMATVGPISQRDHVDGLAIDLDMHGSCCDGESLGLDCRPCIATASTALPTTA